MRKNTDCVVRSRGDCSRGPALAGPPFICHVFDIGSAKSLPWGATTLARHARRLRHQSRRGRHRSAADAVHADNRAHGDAAAGVDLRVARSRGRRTLIAAMMSRVHAADQSGQPMALFDAGYVMEAINELEQSGSHMKRWRARSGSSPVSRIRTRRVRCSRRARRFGRMTRQSSSRWVCCHARRNRRRTCRRRARARSGYAAREQPD